MIKQFKSEKAPVFLDALTKLSRKKNDVDSRTLQYCFDVFQTVIIDLTSSEKLLFNTLFARIAFLGIQHKLPGEFVFELHLFRKEVSDKQLFDDDQQIFGLGLYLIGRLLADVYHHPIPAKLSPSLTKPPYTKNELKFESYYPYVRGLIIRYTENGKYFDFLPDEGDGIPVNLFADKLDLFQNTLNYIKVVLERESWPVPVVIRDIGVAADGSYYPKAIVLEPDYLVDVTSVAECFLPNGARADYYLLSKLVPSESSKYLILGHIVNYILDELIHNPVVTFETLLKSVFHIAPLEFCLLKDEEVLFIINNTKLHYNNLVRVLSKDFPPLALKPSDCIVEPSYYVPGYGLQGRLDVFYHKNNKEASIIELKSGSPFRENLYGLSPSHYTQTLLYDLMISASYNRKIKPLNYILYSKLPEKNIRFAPTIQAAQMEAISIRNDIVRIENTLLDSNAASSLFEGMKLSKHANVNGFLRENIELFEKVYQESDELEKLYFHHFCSFISVEHHIAKTGINGFKENNGMANLWLNDIDKKKESFAIYTNLEIVRNESYKDQPLIVLQKTNLSNELAGFRQGDIVVLTPAAEQDGSRQGRQVLRSTLIDINKDTFTIRLRSKQYNQQLFSSNELWNIEPDFLDSGFRKMYHALFDFLRAEKRKKDLILGRIAPLCTDPDIQIPCYEGLTPNQQKVLTNMLVAKDYFLLWGPPGTGKTSVLLKHAIRFYLENTDKKLLLMAYTNRAVDEICEVLESLNSLEGADYIRIGSRFSTGEKYKNHLLENLLPQFSTRTTLKNKLSETRVFVGTNSSVMGKTELFSLVRLDIAIIDEAAQILEPMLTGILPGFEKFILIGDHKQLPAVVVQELTFSRIHDEKLQASGFFDTSVSLFERLYLRCKKQQWDWAFGQLNEQGRMHEEIMRFVNVHFYEQSLRCLPGFSEQTSLLSDFYGENLQGEILKAERMLFYHVQSDLTYALAKHNPEEAFLVTQMVIQLKKYFEEAGKVITQDTIGVITPFRAQIAQIRNAFREASIDPDYFTIDTVERFQGGGRDIIIFSSVVNSVQRMSQIIDTDKDGLDRKLNVALTRTKKQFILVGNKNILSKNTLYRHLIENCYQQDGL